MRIAVLSLLSSILLAAGTAAQATQYTTTLPYADGDTLVISVSTNPLNGVATTRTVSTITAGANTRTTATTKTTATTTGPDTTTGQRVVGVDTSVAPMRTTTYWYDPGDGVWVEATWTASVTADPTVATAVVAEGTIQDYDSYQTSVNSVVYASATAADAAVSAANAGRILDNNMAGMVGWAAVAVGAIGGAAGLILV